VVGKNGRANGPPRLPQSPSGITNFWVSRSPHRRRPESRLMKSMGRCTPLNFGASCCPGSSPPCVHSICSMPRFPSRRSFWPPRRPRNETDPRAVGAVLLGQPLDGRHLAQLRHDLLPPTITSRKIPLDGRHWLLVSPRPPELRMRTGDTARLAMICNLRYSKHDRRGPEKYPDGKSNTRLR